MMHSYIGEEHGVFGPVGDLFGFDDLGQGPAISSDPLSAVNAPLVAKAKGYLAEFATLSKLVPMIRDVGTQTEAADIIKKKWYPKFNILNPFRGGKDDLNALAAMISGYVKEPFGQFVRFGSDLTVTRTRENRLDAFRSGVKELRKFMAKIVALPVEIVDRGTDMLIASARSLAAKAMATRSAGDIAAARVAAESARDSAMPEGRDDVVREANGIIAQMESMASRTVAPAAGQTVVAGGMEMGTMLMIGGGVLAAAAVAIYFARAK